MQNVARLRLTEPRSDPVAAARIASERAAARAPALDHDGAFPAEDVRDLHALGLLSAVVPERFGGAGLGSETGGGRLAEVLRLVGRGSLPLGRLFEGHVNALQLVARVGTASQQQPWFADALAGHLFGVWNTEAAGDGLTFQLVDGVVRLGGGKILASGAGHVTRALVTGRPPGEPASQPQMLIVPLDPGTRADVSGWRAHGMRASATGSVTFAGLKLGSDALLGGPDDYHAQPGFSGGAWRFAAVQLGGIEAVLGAWRDHLRATGRGGDPNQLARLGAGAIAAETARLWVERAAAVAGNAAAEPERIVAYVNLARSAVERAGLEVLDAAQRSVGLQGFLRDHPLERLGRDLATYLRQPAPDRALAEAAAYVLATADPFGPIPA